MCLGDDPGEQTVIVDVTTNRTAFNAPVAVDTHSIAMMDVGPEPGKLQHCSRCYDADVRFPLVSHQGTMCLQTHRHVRRAMLGARHMAEQGNPCLV